MKTKRVAKYDSKLKTKVVLEALKGENTLNQIGAKFQIHPTNIKAWKRQFFENINQVFEKSSGSEHFKNELKMKDHQIEDLYKQIGKLSTQLEWAKKKSQEYGFDN